MVWGMAGEKHISPTALSSDLSDWAAKYALPANKRKSLPTPGHSQEGRWLERGGEGSVGMGLC
jgi:hypothetical protein